MTNAIARSSFSLSIVLVAAAIGLLIAGVRMTGEAVAINTVEMGDNFFAPQAVEVPSGSAIEWRNDGNLPHTVTAAAGDWDSGMVKKGQTFSQVFNAPGTFAYNCAFHPEMVGTVVVSAAVPDPTAAPTAPPPAAGTGAQNAPPADQASQSLGPGNLPVGGGPPLMDGGAFQSAMVLLALGAALALVGGVTLVLGARQEVDA